MSAIVRTFKTVLGLFVDDGSLALAILALLVWVALLAQSGLVASEAVIMVLLVGGTLALLFENVIRTAGGHGGMTQKVVTTQHTGASA